MSLSGFNDTEKMGKGGDLGMVMYLGSYVVTAIILHVRGPCAEQERSSELFCNLYYPTWYYRCL